MRARPWIVLFLAFAALATGAAFVHADRPSTPRERAKALKLARELEAEPLGARATDSRRWLALWLLEVSDLRVPFCPEVLGADAPTRQRLRTEVLAQITYSGMAWLLENPGHPAAAADIYLAGIQGALRAYEAILRTQPAARSSFLDGLLARRDAGELAAYVAETTKACSGKQP
jgi:hypothetical protein